MIIVAQSIILAGSVLLILTPLFDELPPAQNFFGVSRALKVAVPIEPNALSTEPFEDLIEILGTIEIER